MTATDRTDMTASSASDDLTDRVTELLSAEIDRLIAYFSRRVEPRHEAADLAAETLLVVWRRASALPADPTEARMWVYGIARKTLQSHYRHHRKRLDLADRLREELGHSATAASAAQSTGTDVEEVAALQALVADLPERDRDIVMLHHWDGFTLTEIASMLRMPPASVRSRYHRARKTLREALAQ